MQVLFLTQHFLSFKLHFYVYLCVCICTHTHMHMHVHECIMDRTQPEEPVLSFHHMGPGDGAQVTMLGGKMLHAFLNSPQIMTQSYY